MDEEYDVIVLGTGLKECILSGLLSVDGLKCPITEFFVGFFFGGTTFYTWTKMTIMEESPPLSIESGCQICDCENFSTLVLQFMMANGTLVRVLIHANVTKYLNFKAVDGSFVYNKKKIYKVPATDVEALKSPLMGLLEKRRARKFFLFVQDFDESDPKTHAGMNMDTTTGRELIAKYELDDDTIDFIGHALALHTNDTYLDQPALDFVKRVKLYAESLARFQSGSPYIYPMYGLGELPQAFARLSAVYGGTYMLNKPQCKVEFDESGKAIGVTSEGETAKGKKLSVILHIYLIRYLFCCSYAHNVAPKGKYIAFVSTEAETDNPEAELKPGVDLLGKVDEIFMRRTTDSYPQTTVLLTIVLYLRVMMQQSPVMMCCPCRKGSRLVGGPECSNYPTSANGSVANSNRRSCPGIQLQVPEKTT
ncbi:UNVERIFIED_CONTAM: Guanosine nucleotide diphosphate dissociation inhibitor [Sesamum radiatum]|uniref:Guanosine nucleotide diphosphate dissociation inhibitor n=1 Tax=Sesamum radiatum TaxID=300843 RepID=A0AAW2S514_SESRA